MKRPVDITSPNIQSLSKLNSDIHSLTKLSMKLKTRILATAGSLVGLGGVTSWWRIKQNKNNLPQIQLPLAGEREGGKKAVVVGAGVAGVSSAFQLARRGYRVTILESSSSPGEECSAAAAGGMQRSNPVLNRTSWMSVINQWNPFHPDQFKFFHINLLQTITDPHFLRWITLFSFHSLFQTDSLKERQEEQFKFTLFSLDIIKKFIKERGIEEVCGINPGGALFVQFEESAPGKKGGSMTAEPIQRIDKEALLSVDSSLRKWSRQPVCADFETESWAGNSQVFTKTLARICQEELGVEILTDTKVEEVDVKKNEGGERRIVGLRTNRGVIAVDDNTEVVMAAGSWTPRLMALCGYFCPVYPMKGYSVAMDLLGDETKEEVPSRIVVAGKTYVSRLGNQVRLTSIGEFSGWGTKPDGGIDRMFREEGRKYLSGKMGELLDSCRTRVGLRPYSADGIILLGRVKGVHNLSVNVGPGFNGWKICLGAGDVLASVIDGLPDNSLATSVSQYQFDCSKLSPEKRIKPAPVWSFLSRSLW